MIDAAPEDTQEVNGDAARGEVPVFTCGSYVNCARKGCRSELFGLLEF